jgi:hypothetical protein
MRSIAASGIGMRKAPSDMDCAKATVQATRFEVGVGKQVSDPGALKKSHGGSVVVHPYLLI